MTPNSDIYPIICIIIYITDITKKWKTSDYAIHFPNDTSFLSVQFWFSMIQLRPKRYISVLVKAEEYPTWFLENRSNLTEIYLWNSAVIVKNVCLVSLSCVSPLKKKIQIWCICTLIVIVKKAYTFFTDNLSEKCHHLIHKPQ